jgi:NAD(P)-dependent dehydrogenase (short-subunit alcohol dehydrogenase family)
MSAEPKALLEPQGAPQPSLRGRVVIVTGGSRGLGAAVARTLGEDGARIAVADLAFERAEQLVAELDRQRIEAIAMPVDVGSDEQVQHLVARVIAHWGRLDAVVNNAAIDITLPIRELTATDWERVVRTNLTGPFLLARHAAAALRVSSGHIVNIASTASKRAWANAAAYHATKWGLLGLSHALHAELRPQGIKVCAVVAGGMRTPFLLERFPDIDTDMLQDPLNVARAIRFVLLQPAETVIPELMVLPMRETSWP